MPISAEAIIDHLRREIGRPINSNISGPGSREIARVRNNTATWLMGELITASPTPNDVLADTITAWILADGHTVQDDVR